MTRPTTQQNKDARLFRGSLAEAASRIDSPATMPGIPIGKAPIPAACNIWRRENMAVGSDAVFVGRFIDCPSASDQAEISLRVSLDWKVLSARDGIESEKRNNTNRWFVAGQFDAAPVRAT